MECGNGHDVLGGHLAVLGGDRRSRYLAEALAEKEWKVFSFGVEKGKEKRHISEEYEVREVPTVEEALRGAGAVLLPQPAFVRERQLFCPFIEGEAPTAEKIFSCLSGDVPVFGGRFSPAMTEYDTRCGIRLIDYMKLEDVQLRNALPTAEGAIYLAMQQLERTLDGAKVAVLGYGRIGFLLAQKLQFLGSHVTVAVRKSRDAAALENQHLEVLRMRFEGGESSLQKLQEGYDVVFNTVPYRILRGDILRGMPPETLLMELASAPGGWDPSEQIPCRTCYAPGLPGSFAPQTAGKILAECLEPLLDREGKRP